MATRLVSKQFGTWLTATFTELHLNSPDSRTASLSWLCLARSSPLHSVHPLHLLHLPPPSPGLKSTLGLNSPQGSISLPYLTNFQGLITMPQMPLRVFYLRAFSQGVHLTHSLLDPLPPSGDSLLPSPHLHLSLWNSPSLLALCLLIASCHFLGICPLAVGKAGTLDRAGHWEVVAKHLLGLP